jgi:hypothetical protein
MAAGAKAGAVLDDRPDRQRRIAVVEIGEKMPQTFIFRFEAVLFARQEMAVDAIGLNPLRILAGVVRIVLPGNILLCHRVA